MVADPDAVRSVATGPIGETARPAVAPTPDYDTEWQRRYQKMVMTAEQAVAKIRPGQRVFIGTGGAQPLRLVRALVARHAALADLLVLQSLTF